MRSLALTLTFLFLFTSTSPALAVENPRIKSKSIAIPANSEWADVNIQAVINASPTAVWKTVSDISEWPKWLPMNRRAEIISNAAAERITPELALDRNAVNELAKEYPAPPEPAHEGGAWRDFVVEEYDLPWPIDNEWVVRRYDFNASSNPPTTSWKKLDSKEAQDDGGWEIVALDDANKCLFNYHYRVKVKKGVPKSIFKAAVSVTIGSMVKSLQREALR